MYQKNKKKIAAIIEARMTSSRLPGKVMLPLAGKPALYRLIERLQRSMYLDSIIVATTVNEADEPIVALCRSMGIPFFRGSEQDVLDRVLQAAHVNNVDIIVEITGDCPMMDAALVDKGVEEFFSYEVDYVANDLTASYPLGYSVQVYPTDVLERVATLTADPIDRVHVTYYIYTHTDQFSVHGWGAPDDAYGPNLRVTLDEKDDYELIGKIYDHFCSTGNDDFNVADVVSYLRENPDLAKSNNHVRQKHASEG